MKYRLVLLLCGMIVLMRSSAGSADIRAIITQATRGLKDITLAAKVLYANHTELKKIGKDFPKSYEFKTTTIRYKAPDKMRVEGKLGMVHVVIVTSGTQKVVQIPAIRYSKREDIADEPHKRQTDIDIGIVSGNLWQDYKVIKAVEEMSPSGMVYKITFVRKNALEKNHVCWVDADTLKLLKVEKYESDGSLKSRYLFSKHELVSGLVWVPRQIDVYNQEGKLAATTAYEDIKVNTGIPDSVFAI